jgi:hydrogenase nickel incorporation protein HypA/HybF
MHELSIATAILDEVGRAVAAQPEPVRVVRVEIEVGELKLVVPESLQTAWEAVRLDTPFGEVLLVVHEKKARARCRQCGSEFPAAVGEYACPGCHAADAEILEGNEILMQCLVCESEEEEK